MTLTGTELHVHRYQRTNRVYSQSLADGIDLTMMLIPSGEYLRGAPETELESRDSERPQDMVSIPSFFMGRNPVTEAQWKAIIETPQFQRNLSKAYPSQDGNNYPVTNVTWHEAQEFCKRLSIHTDKEYRLPSESEWEYACRAETLTPFHFGETLTPELANYDWSRSYNSGPTDRILDQKSEINRFPANDWGLHDMHGNISEWCQDSWHDTYKGSPKDGSAWSDSSSYRVIRGGSWVGSPGSCRSSVRVLYKSDVRDISVGFRVVVSTPTAFQ